MGEHVFYHEHVFGVKRDRGEDHRASPSEERICGLACWSYRYLIWASKLLGVDQRPC
jgi:hypothetical protein